MSSQEDPQLKNQVIDLGTAVATIPYPVLVGGADRNALSIFGGRSTEFDCKREEQFG